MRLDKLSSIRRKLTKRECKHSKRGYYHWMHSSQSSSLFVSMITSGFFNSFAEMRTSSRSSIIICCSVSRKPRLAGYFFDYLLPIIVFNPFIPLQEREFVEADVAFEGGVRSTPPLSAASSTSNVVRKR